MVKQEFDKKELANSNRIFKSATPEEKKDPKYFK